MRIFKPLLAICLVALTSCGQLKGFNRHYDKDNKSSQSVVITHQTIKELSGASARYIVKQKIELIDGAGKIVVIQRGLWTGSAFCIGTQFDPNGVEFSVWATCRHVADTKNFSGTFAEIDYIDRKGIFAWAKVDKIYLSKDYDIALFTSLALPRNILELANEEELSFLKQKDILLAIGHPAGMQPAVLTIGAFLWETKEGYRFTTSATYGSSGSALIDAKSMKVIGVIYKFAGAKNRDGSYRSDDLAAVPAYELRKLLDPIR